MTHSFLHINSASHKFDNGCLLSEVGQVFLAFLNCPLMLNQIFEIYFMKTLPKHGNCLNNKRSAWKLGKNFLEILPKDEELPSVPIWSREFGATYPFEETTPHALGVDKLREYQGNYGTPLKGLDDDEVWQNLPAYAKRGARQIPTHGKSNTSTKIANSMKSTQVKSMNGFLRF